jgi:hypothetical protein
MRRVRWSAGDEDRLLRALARQIEHHIATGVTGQRTSKRLGAQHRLSRQQGSRGAP